MRITVPIPRLVPKNYLWIACLTLLVGAAVLLSDRFAFADVDVTNADQRKNETLITAQQMFSDQDSGIVTATGQVEIARGEYILHADKVTYNENTGVMHAEGRVSILMPSGEVQFADQEEVTGDMKQAFAENVGILFPDNSRLAAKSMQRYEGRYTVAEKGNYTACNVCLDDPSNPPLWQVRGQQVVHDNLEHEVYYHDATIDFIGIPALYTPYFSAPDPTVDRKQGFLAPTPGVSSNIGPFVKVPYYFDIAPNEDATLTPSYSQKDGPQLGVEYRKRQDTGYMQMDGSFTRADLISPAGIDNGQQWRGDMFGTFLYNLDNVWRTGMDVNFASDKSYLERYNISSQDQLTSRAYVEGFQGRNYAAVNGYYFEDLRPGTTVVQPLVLPEASFSALGEPGQMLGGRWSFDGSTLLTTRENTNQGIAQQGPDTRRLSLDTGWQRKLVSDSGMVTTLSGLLRADTYSADNVINPNGSGQVFNNVLLARQFEQANAVIGYPLARSGSGYQQIVEPLVALTAAPDVKISAKQPIEDSLDTGFDETNLFSPNRFTGTDLIEGGNRATYGLRQSLVTDSGGRLEVFGGQSYDTSKNTDFSGLTGLHDEISDYVGRVDFSPISWFNANYGFRLDHKDFNFKRQDAVMSVGNSLFRPTARYISGYVIDPTTGLLVNEEELNFGFSSNFIKYWTLSANHTQAFQPAPGPRGTSVSLNYVDECFIYGVTANENDTNRADLSSGISVVFHVFLKNLGGAHTDGVSTAQFAPQFRQTE